MHGLPVVQRGRPVGRRAHQRMPEPHPGSELEQASPGRRRRGLSRDAQPPGGAPHHRRIAGRLGRRDHQQPPGRPGQVLHPPQEAVLDPARQRQRLRQPEPARQLGRGQPPRQLQQRQRVPPRLGHDLLRHPLIQRPPHQRAQQLPRIRIPQPLDRQLRQPGQLRAWLPCREQHQHPLRPQPACRERQRLRRGPVQPLRVIDHAHQRTLGGRTGQQAQHGQADQETIRRGARFQAERRPQRITLRDRQLPQPIEHRPAQPLQPGEREVHLRLHPRGPQHPQIRRRPRHVIQQGRLPDPRLAPHHERGAVPVTQPFHQPAQRLALAAAPVQHRQPRGHENMCRRMIAVGASVAGRPSRRVCGGFTHGTTSVDVVLGCLAAGCRLPIRRAWRGHARRPIECPLVPASGSPANAIGLTPPQRVQAVRDCGVNPIAGGPASGHYH